MKKQEGKEKTKKLRLHPETVRILATHELNKIVGGEPLDTAVVGCYETGNWLCYEF